MKSSNSIAALAKSLVSVQVEMKAIPKDSTNPHFKSQFASLDTIVDTTRPILAKHGLAVMQGAATSMLDESHALCGFEVETILVHQSGEWISTSVYMPLAKVDPQGAGSAMTYGRRYGLSALLSLSTDEDDDGNRASTRPQQSAPASRSSSAPSQSSGNAADKLMPFGKTKGKKLGALPDDALKSTLEWCLEKDGDKFKDLIAALRSVLNDRALGPSRSEPPDHDDWSRPIDDGDDSLPF